MTPTQTPTNPERTSRRVVIYVGTYWKICKFLLTALQFDILLTLPCGCDEFIDRLARCIQHGLNKLSVIEDFNRAIVPSMKRVFFDKIDSVGKFPDNRVKMDILFQDSNGNEYVWTPKWEEVMSIYAESERVEEMNLAGGEWLEELKEKKQFSDEVLDEVAEVIADGRSTGEIANFFEIVGFDPDGVRHNLSYDDPLRNKVEGLSNRVYIAKTILQELNSKDYRHVVQVVQLAADPKQYIGEQERHQEVVEKLKAALEFENLRVTEDGRVLPIEKGG